MACNAAEFMEFSIEKCIEIEVSVAVSSPERIAKS
jgi:hypothetical protein